MKTSKLTAAAVAMGVVFSAVAANAQEATKDQASDRSETTKLAPASNAIELTIGTGYAQGFGNVASGQPSLTDVGTAGGAVQVGAGYRLIPQLTLGAYGSGAAFGRGDQVDSSAKLWSASAGVQADWHFSPSDHDLDPWVSLGSGWRGYWVSADRGTTSLHGWEIAKLQVGVDYRLTREVAISPVIGADLTTFFTQSTPGASGFASIDSPEVTTFVFGGIQGRFDVPLGGGAARVASR